MSARDAAIDLAKRHLVDCIYSSACVEGLGITFPQTQQILDNISVPGVRPRDIMFVLNMREAWRFVLDTLDEPVNMLYVREINRICGNGLIYGCGVLRESNVSITGTSYVPKIPQHDDVVYSLKEISCIADVINRAVYIFEYLAKEQLFIDGNKRVAQLVANKILISDGVGILKIPDTTVKEFANVLVDYYENDSCMLEDYLLNNCFIKAVPVDIVEFKNCNFTVGEIVESLPPFVRERYSSDLECAKDNVETYYNSMM